MPVAIITDAPDDAYESTAMVGKCQPQHSTASARVQREIEGRCGNCGIQTHEFYVDPNTQFLVKVPLTIKKEVHRGRCLFCHPLLGHQNLNHQVSRQQLTSARSPFQRRRYVLDRSHHSLLQDIHPFNAAVREALAVIEGPAVDIIDILSAMTSLPNDMIIQSRGLERLWILSWEDDYASDIGCVGGISIILNAMARFPMNSHLQLCGCECVQNLAINDKNCWEICELSGIVLIVEAMLCHPTAAGIQQSGCNALANIAYSTTCGKSNIDHIVNVGGLYAILCAARTFVDQESVMMAAHDALRSLGYDQDGRVTPSPDEIR